MVLIDKDGGARALSKQAHQQVQEDAPKSQGESLQKGSQETVRGDQYRAYGEAAEIDQKGTRLTTDSLTEKDTAPGVIEDFY